MFSASVNALKYAIFVQQQILTTLTYCIKIVTNKFIKNKKNKESLIYEGLIIFKLFSNLLSVFKTFI